MPQLVGSAVLFTEENNLFLFYLASPQVAYTDGLLEME